MRNGRSCVSKKLKGSECPQLRLTRRNRGGGHQDWLLPADVLEARQNARSPTRDNLLVFWQRFPTLAHHKADRHVIRVHGDYLNNIFHLYYVSPITLSTFNCPFPSRLCTSMLKTSPYPAKIRGSAGELWPALTITPNSTSSKHACDSWLRIKMPDCSASIWRSRCQADESSSF